MNDASYRISFERVPFDHPLSQKIAYQRRVEQRDLLCSRMIGQPIPAGWQAFIVEVNTSLIWAVERPQLVMGTVEDRVRLRLKAGHRLEDGSAGLSVIREPTFVEIVEGGGSSAITVYGDDRLSVEVEAIGRATFFEQTETPGSGEVRDPLRLHQHRPIRRRLPRREPADRGERLGKAFSTRGDTLPVETTSDGTPLSAHMLVRLLVPESFPLAIARSFLGIRTAFSPDEVFPPSSTVGVCYEVLYRPQPDDGL